MSNKDEKQNLRGPQAEVTLTQPSNASNDVLPSTPGK